MKSLIFSLLLLGGIKCTTVAVYICDSPNARKYHLTATCRGLSNCQHRIIKTTLDSAKTKGLTLCGWER